IVINTCAPSVVLIAYLFPAYLFIPTSSPHLSLKLLVLVPGDSDQDLVLTLSRRAAGLAAFDYDYPLGLLSWNSVQCRFR
ncbi:hypothetical protein BDR07DRAFT_1472553, partial [Suillus spraguei]